MRGVRVAQAILVVAAAMIGALIGLATNAASMKPAPWRPLLWLQTQPWLAMVMLVGIAGGLEVVAILLERRSRRERTDLTNELTLTQIADQLGTAVERQWRAEAQFRRLNDPQPLPVAWYPADLDLVEPWDNLCVTATGWPGGSSTNPARWATSPAELAGSDNELADRLAQIPTDRLLVLGDPGAGKTILLIRLVLDLLARRRPGDPVPVLVPVAGWNPIDQDLPYLACRPAGRGPSRARRPRPPSWPRQPRTGAAGPAATPADPGRPERTPREGPGAGPSPASMTG